MIKARLNLYLNYVAVAALALLPLGGCTVEEEWADGVEVLTVQMEGDPTRVTLTPSTGSLTWTSGDQIAVLTTSTIRTCDVDVSTNKVIVPLNSVEMRQGYAVYPASAVSTLTTSSVVVTYPASYDISDDLTSEQVPIPMVAVNSYSSNTLTFRHVGGLLRINATLPAGTVTVEVTTTGDPIVGNARVTNPGTADATSAIASGSHTVTFTVHATGLASSQAVTLNMPVPCGTYTGFTVKAYNSSNVEIGSYSDASTYFVDRTSARRVAFNTVNYTVIVSGTNSIWTNEYTDLTATVKDAMNNTVSGATVTWSRVFGSSANVNASTGRVTANTTCGSNTFRASVTIDNHTYKADYVVSVKGINSAMITYSQNSIPVNGGALCYVEGVQDSNGAAINSGYTVSWSSGSPDCASVNSVNDTNVGRITGLFASCPTICANITYKGRTITVYNDGLYVTQPVDHYFSVSSSDLVVFSPGNLQYLPSDHTYRFAPDQFVYIGEDNVYILGGDSSLEWIDLFGWGTGEEPIMISLDDSDYTTFNDWGNNSIVRGLSTDPSGRWRTLTSSEWDYLLSRDGYSRLGYAIVCGVVGLIIIPDSFVDPHKNTAWYADFITGPDSFGNEYNLEGWLAMENAGAIFLPLAGFREGYEWSSRELNNGYAEGFYWSSTASEGEAIGYFFTIGEPYINQDIYPLHRGYSVRLVRDVPSN